MNNILALFNVGSNVMLSLGIIFVLVFIVFYIRQRLSDYDNKINSMFQLVSKMTNEIRFLKTPLPTIHENTVLPDYKTEELRVVSLDVNEEEDEDVDEDVREDVSDNNNDYEEDQENEVEDNENVDIDDNEYENEDNNESSASEDDLKSNIDETLLQNDNEEILEEFNENNTIKPDDIRLVEFDKTLDENVENITIPNFKKLKFDELKTLVSTKGLANEIQKLRKAELVSLLEEDFKKQKKSTTNEMELV